MTSTCSFEIACSATACAVAGSGGAVSAPVSVRAGRTEPAAATRRRASAFDTFCVQATSRTAST
jgi:hypothetical protein